MKKYILGLLLFILFSPMTLAENKLNKDVSVMLAWFMNPNYGNFVIAQKKGFFKVRGLNVTLLEPSNPTDPAKFLAIKKVDYALGHQPSLQMQGAK